MILGVFVGGGGNQPRRLRARPPSAWCLLDERGGVFLDLGVLPSGANTTELLTRFAAIANRAAGCEAIITNRGSSLLDATAAVCQGAPKIITVKDDVWRRAVMPSATWADRRDIAFTYYAAEHILSGHERARTALYALRDDYERIAVALAAMIALGGALTTHDIRARVLTDEARTDDADDPADDNDPWLTQRPRKRKHRAVVSHVDRALHRSRLELASFYGKAEYDKRVAERAREIDAVRTARAKEARGDSNPVAVAQPQADSCA